ncbi:PREDICTED: uncharacterized protein LOC106741811 [Dinoponera quadriceps]|uniref:Uncharacterized protein LOC106741811 n=1 Tax=Dinoponera quadriceps TaxID=609295 RepID=A0A6P3WUB9_DINQU|nr:PREDICTED: uncharacterized protein LOC106741811 [Dinoponera quadriceps]
MFDSGGAVAAVEVVVVMVAEDTAYLHEHPPPLPLPLTLTPTLRGHTASNPLQVVEVVVDEQDTANSQTGRANRIPRSAGHARVINPAIDARFRRMRAGLTRERLPRMARSSNSRPYTSLYDYHVPRFHGGRSPARLRRYPRNGVTGVSSYLRRDTAGFVGFRSVHRRLSPERREFRLSSVRRIPRANRVYHRPLHGTVVLAVISFSHDDTRPPIWQRL